MRLRSGPPRAPHHSLLVALLTGVLLAACGSLSRSTSPTRVTATPAPVVATPARPKPSDPPEPYKLGLDQADGAFSISQSAQSQDDWNLVIGRWQQAIQLMKSVAPSSPYRSQATAKLSEYQQNLAAARTQASRAALGEAALKAGRVDTLKQVGAPSSVIISSSAAPPQPGKSVFRVNIKRRAGGTPVVDVVFNGSQTFEMIVDTGASGTVITPQMAHSLGVRVTGKTTVDTASDRDVEVPLAQVGSLSVGGAQVNNLTVAIGGPALEIGLLGHDFFGNYDVTVKQDVVEFRQR